MRLWQIQVLILLVNSFVLAKVYSREEYPFPITDGDLATISSAIPYNAKYEFKKIEINIFPNRSNIYLLEEQNILKLNFLYQNKTAPLMFIIPGVGGVGNGPLIENLMEFYFDLGFHVIALPNPISWNFALAVSASGIPGRIIYDVQDLNKLINHSLDEIKKLGVAPSSISLTGFSLGAALLPALVKNMESDSHLKLSRVIMLNPPINFKYSIAKIDSFYDLGKNWSEDFKNYIYGYLYAFAERLMSSKEISPFSIESYFRLNVEQKRFVIGNVYRQSIADLIFTQELLLNHRVLKSELAWGKRTSRQHEALKFSFQDYLEKILLPFVQKSDPEIKNTEKLFAEYDIKNQKEVLTIDNRFYIFHNIDDFLFSREDLAFIKTTFPEERYFIYPMGGHCGNYNFPINRKDLSETLELLVN